MRPNEPEPDRRASVCVAADPAADAALLHSADALARELGLPLADPRAELQLTVTHDRLELRVLHGDADLRRGRGVVVDLLKADTTSPRGLSLRQPLARAIGLLRRTQAPELHVFDATAGLGDDMWLMASLGCTVRAVERCPAVFALLRDGLARATSALPGVAARITLALGDGRETLRRVAQEAAGRPDVVYLDPMFEPGRKTIGPKSMRVLRALVGPDADCDELFRAAASVARRRVVVKRPIHASPISPNPTAVFEGKSLRYDMYAVASLSRA